MSATVRPQLPTAARHRLRQPVVSGHPHIWNPKMAGKQFKLRAEQIQPLVPPMGACFASDMITVLGNRVGYMYREEPSFEVDSGWRFLAGMESQEYLDNPDNLQIYDVNTIANYDPEIIPFLSAAIGSAFERQPPSGGFASIDS